MPIGAKMYEQASADEAKSEDDAEDSEDDKSDKKDEAVEGEVVDDKDAKKE